MKIVKKTKRTKVKKHGKSTFASCPFDSVAIASTISIIWKMLSIM